MQETETGVAGVSPGSEPSPHARENMAALLSDLVVNGSIELIAEGTEVLSQASRLLPYGMSVYVPATAKHALADNLERLAALRTAGFNPVPHIAARRVASAAELRDFLERAIREAGVRRVLVIGGDGASAQGEFADSAAVIRSGILSAAGIQEIDVAGYPEGHPVIPLPVLREDLETKLQMAAEQGLGINVLTQFSFSPARIIEYCDEMAHLFPRVSVFAGLAGPTSTATLLRYARYCGVSASLRALSSLGVKAAKLASHTSPDEQAEVLARYNAGHESSNLIGIHIYSFGGFLRAAEWMRQKLPHA